MSGRYDWVEANLRCLLCGRTLGRLLGRLASNAGATWVTAGRLSQFSAFSPAEPDRPAIRLTGREQFHCSACGGRGFVDEVETFAVYNDLLEEEPRPRRRGRPPKPWRHVGRPDPLTALGLAG